MIVAAGEALVDLTHLEVDGVTAYVPHPGGSPYNVAVGLGRLGVPTAFLGRIARDHFGRLLRDHLHGSGVSLDLVVDAGAERTTVAFVHDASGEPEYSFYAEGSADRMLLPEHLPELPSAAALHLGSISLVLEPTGSTLEGLLRREAGTRLISLDPNVRPGLIDDPAAYRRRLGRWMELVDVVKVSAVDLAWLTPGATLESTAAEWLEAGAALVLVTKGPEGSWAITRQTAVHADAPQVKVADTIGAGDALTAGALAHLHDHGWLSRERVASLTADQLHALLTEANAVAADTCTRRGAEPPWRQRPA